MKRDDEAEAKKNIDAIINKEVDSNTETIIQEDADTNNTNIKNENLTSTLQKEPSST